MNKIPDKYRDLLIAPQRVATMESTMPDFTAST